MTLIKIFKCTIHCITGNSKQRCSHYSVACDLFSKFFWCQKSHRVQRHWVCKPALFCACSKPGLIGRVVAERAFGKNGGMRDNGGGGHNSQDGVVSRRIISASASVIFTCTTKSRRWRAVMEEVGKGCSEFCVTVGTVTRTVSILIHSQLKALAVNSSQPSDRLWLYAGLIGSNNPRWLKADLVVWEWRRICTELWVSKCFFWYWLTQVVPYKGPWGISSTGLLQAGYHSGHNTPIPKCWRKKNKSLSVGNPHP